MDTGFRRYDKDGGGTVYFPMIRWMQQNEREGQWDRLRG
jgi:hypothetical protein